LEDWLSKALDMFPELAEDFERSDVSPGSFWIELDTALHFAYEEEPSNDDLIGRIYDYAAWCFAQPQTDDVETDLASATAVGFIENIPLHLKVSRDLYRWMSVESFLGFENLFRYHLDTEDAYRKFHDGFMEKKKGYFGLSRI
jgi:hypothetical protein